MRLKIIEANWSKSLGWLLVPGGRVYESDIEFDGDFVPGEPVIVTVNRKSWECHAHGFGEGESALGIVYATRTQPDFWHHLGSDPRWRRAAKAA